MRHLLPLWLVPLALGISPIFAQEAHETLRVAATLPYLGEITREVGGDSVSVVVLVRPGVDPHHIQTTPALSQDVSAADLLIENGMQLEAWVPRLVDASGRADLAPGGARHCYATNGLIALEVPTADEIAAGGHVHPAGNPHAWLDPLNLKTVARNIEQALTSIAPSRRAGFEERRLAFERRIDVSFFGEELVGLLDGRTLENLHRGSKLIPFLEGREVQGRRLIESLGGWLARSRALSAGKVFAYHSTWSYFAKSFGLEVVATLEEKPGIPPGPAHLEKLAKIAQAQGVRVVIAAPYYPRARIEGFAEMIRGYFAPLPTQPGELGSSSYFDMIDRIFAAIEAAQLQAGEH